MSSHAHFLFRSGESVIVKVMRRLLAAMAGCQICIDIFRQEFRKSEKRVP